MDTQTVPIHRNLDDEILFVGTDGIISTMVKVPLILPSLIASADRAGLGHTDHTTDQGS